MKKQSRVVYARCGWYFCSNHLADYEHGTAAARWWRKDTQGVAHCPEHAHLISTPIRVKAGVSS